MDTTTAAPATPVRVYPWFTAWEVETFTAAIAGGKVHTVTRTLGSENAEANVANPAAKRENSYYTDCGTTRRGRYLRVEKSDTVTCVKCAKRAQS